MREPSKLHLGKQHNQSLTTIEFRPVQLVKAFPRLKHPLCKIVPDEVSCNAVLKSTQRHLFLPSTISWRSFYQEVEPPKILLVHPRSQNAQQVNVRFSASLCSLEIEIGGMLPAKLNVKLQRHHSSICLSMEALRYWHHTSPMRLPSSSTSDLWLQEARQLAKTYTGEDCEAFPLGSTNRRVTQQAATYFGSGAVDDMRMMLDSQPYEKWVTSEEGLCYLLFACFLILPIEIVSKAPL